MEELFCIKCGVKAIPNGNYCSSCGALLHRPNWSGRSLKTSSGFRWIRASDRDSQYSTKINTQESDYLSSQLKSKYDIALVTAGRSGVARKFSGNPILRHWRGEYPMPVALLIVGLVTFVITGLTQIFLASIELGSDSLGQLARGSLMIFQSAVFFLPPIWYVTGTLRTAKRIFCEDNNHMSAIAGSIAVVVVLGAMMWFTGPAMSVAFQIGVAQLKGEQWWGDYEIRLANRNTELIFDGHIDYGAAADMERILDTNPAVAIVHLRSNGGGISEGKAMGRIIRLHELSTYVSDFCNSACTIAYIAGKERLLANNGSLGFHAGSIEGQRYRDKNVIDEDMAQAYRSTGVDNTFIVKALSVSPEEMWYPNNSELLDAGVVTTIVDPKYYAAIQSLSDYQQSELEDRLTQESDLWLVLQNHDSYLFELAVGIMSEYLTESLPMIEIQHRLRTQVIQPAMRKYLKRAPAPELRAYYQVVYEQIAYLNSTNVAACRDFLLAEDADKVANALAALPQDLISNETEALSAALRAALGTPKDLDVKDAENAFLKIIHHLENNDQRFAGAIFRTDDYKHNSSLVCDAYLRFFQIVLSEQYVRSSGDILRMISEKI